MREIKFRAWDIEEKEWIEGDNGSKVRVAAAFPKSVVLMQFTGLKDKTGKEIYEGDTVKQHSECDYGSDHFEFDSVGEVVILASMGTCLKNPKRHEDGEAPYTVKGYCNVRSYRSEITGNIYEGESCGD